MQLVIFQLYLILHACVQRFDVTDIVGSFLETKRLYIGREWRLLEMQDWSTVPNLLVQICMQMHK